MEHAGNGNLKQSLYRRMEESRLGLVLSRKEEKRLLTPSAA